MNVITLVGNICNDLELKLTPTGKSVLQFNLAVKRPHVKDTTDFIPVVAWNQSAEFLSRYARKGSKIGVTGVLTGRKFQDKSGNNRTAFEVVSDTVELLDIKGNSDQGTNAVPQQNVAQNANFGAAVDDQPNYVDMANDEDLPF